MAVAGLTMERKDHAKMMAKFSIAVSEAVRSIPRPDVKGEFIKIRIG